MLSAEGDKDRQTQRQWYDKYTVNARTHTVEYVERAGRNILQLTSTHTPDPSGKESQTSFRVISP